MSRQTAKPDTVKTLKEWIARWPKARNLGFDPDTREPTIYSDKDHVRINSIPWKREADTLTVLSDPTRFSAQAVAAATSRYGKIREQQSQMRGAGDAQQNLAETAVLDAWRAYNAAAEADRGALRRDILSTERALRDIERLLAKKDKTLIVDDDKKIFLAYNLPMPLARRGISLVDAAASS